MTLSMTMYGMAAINPGDLFRVDYLPSQYRDKVYFQVTKVSHEISTTSWATSFETVMRISPSFKDAIPLYGKREIYLSTKFFDKMQIAEPSNFFQTNKHMSNPKGDTKPKLVDIVSHMEVVSDHGVDFPTQIDYILKFKCLKNITNYTSWIHYMDSGWSFNIHNDVVDEYTKCSKVSLNKSCEPRLAINKSPSDSTNFEAYLARYSFTEVGMSLYRNYIYGYKIDLVEGKTYKLILSRPTKGKRGYCIVPEDISDKSIDIIDQAYFMISSYDDGDEADIPRLSKR